MVHQAGFLFHSGVVDQLGVSFLHWLYPDSNLSQDLIGRIDISYPKSFREFQSDWLMWVGLCMHDIAFIKSFVLQIACWLINFKKDSKKEILSIFNLTFAASWLKFAFFAYFFVFILKMFRLLVLVLTCLLLGSVSGDRGSCAKASKCCSGRDSSCIVNGLQAYGGYVQQPCYCDEGCLETGDCCFDYKQICSVKGQ